MRSGVHNMSVAWNMLTGFIEIVFKHLFILLEYKELSQCNIGLV